MRLFCLFKTPWFFFLFTADYFIDWKKHRKAPHDDLRMRSILLFSCHQLLPKKCGCGNFDSWRHGLQKCWCHQGFAILSNWKNRSYSICTCCAAHFATWSSVHHQGTYTTTQWVKINKNVSCQNFKKISNFCQENDQNLLLRMFFESPILGTNLDFWRENSIF